MDPLGRQPVRNVYDADGRLVSTTDALGHTVTLTHNLAARQEVVTDRLGHSTTYSYDPRGNIVQQTDALGDTRSFVYDTNDSTLSETEAGGNVYEPAALHKYVSQTAIRSTGLTQPAMRAWEALALRLPPLPFRR